MKLFKPLLMAVITLVAIVVASCNPIEDFFDDVVSDFKIGQSWDDGSFTIKKIGFDTYWVEDQYDGYGEVYTLTPFSQVLHNKPYNVRILGHQPIFRSGELRWKVQTSRGVYHVFSGGGWYSF